MAYNGAQEEVVVVYEGEDGNMVQSNVHGEPMVVDPANIELAGAGVAGGEGGGGGYDRGFGDDFGGARGGGGGPVGEARVEGDFAEYGVFGNNNNGNGGGEPIAVYAEDEPYVPPAAYNQPPVYVHGADGLEEYPDGVRGGPQHAASFRRMGTQRVNPENLPAEELEERYQPYFCYFMIFLNCLMFMISIIKNKGFESLRLNPMIGPSNAVLVDLGAKVASKIRKGDWYRLVAPMFLHAGLIHLLMNMSVLWRQGRDMERVVGWWRLALIYFCSGVFGVIMSCIFIPDVIGVGASGALFGILGAMFGEFIYNYKYIREGKWWYFTQLVLNSLFLFILGLMPYLDNFAHIGGWTCGIVSSCVFLNGAYINPDNGKPTRKAFLFICCLAILIIMYITGFAVLYNNIDGNRWCSGCHYLSCVDIPSLWDCSVQNSCIQVFDPATNTTECMYS